MSPFTKILKLKPNKLIGIVSHGFHSGGYERKGIFTPELILPQISNTKKYNLSANGVTVGLYSPRLLTFKKSLECVGCGIKGAFFAIERAAAWDKMWRAFATKNSSWHMNLYGLFPDDSEVLMTKDHIIPKSKGGTENLENLQTMCVFCNAKKADRLLDTSNEDFKKNFQIDLIQCHQIMPQYNEMFLYPN